MSIETQETIGAWARATFPGGDDLSPRHCLRLLEEVCELCLAAGASPYEITEAAEDAADNSESGWFERAPESPEKIAKEMADCAIALDVLAERRGVDLRAEVDRKMAVNRYEREWIPKGDGTGYHKRKDVNP